MKTVLYIVLLAIELAVGVLAVSIGCRWLGAWVGIVSAALLAIMLIILLIRARRRIKAGTEYTPKMLLRNIAAAVIVPIVGAVVIDAIVIIAVIIGFS